MSQNQRKVYIVNNGGHDYSDAEKFGDIVFCTEGALAKDDISQMYREMDSALMDAKATDLILITSLASLCAVAAAIMADRFGEVHFLIYHNGKYQERDLVFGYGERDE